MESELLSELAILLVQLKYRHLVDTAPEMLYVVLLFIVTLLPPPPQAERTMVNINAIANATHMRFTIPS
jgi:hypothetical protein